MNYLDDSRDGEQYIGNSMKVTIFGRLVWVEKFDSKVSTSAKRATDSQSKLQKEIEYVILILKILIKTPIFDRYKKSRS